MDGKRTVDRMVLPRKASGHVLRENMNKREDEKSVSFCSRIGCSANVSHTKGTRMDNNTKLGSSSNGKEIVGSSSRTPGGFGYLRKPATFTTGRRLRSSSLDTDSSETSSVHDDRILPRQKAKRGTVIVHSQNTVSGEEVAMTKTGSFFIFC
ncbi:hypothetical protein F2Q68_00007222 [Brassica cretica]|uniref:Uncharacterized protein n=1 Tax=Brassica cretica TaxID=69181 RepID=A0A8S9KT68_BRACR|nr:hypothetical protein F2Q68_00007222 [Brassica cretica]